VVFQPKNMSVQQLAEGHERAWKAVYDWSSIGKRLWHAKNFQPLALSANLGYRFYSRNLHKFYNCDWQINSLIPHPSSLFDFKGSEKIALIDEPKNKTVCG